MGKRPPDWGTVSAAADGSEHRSSTLLNAHRAFRISTGGSDPAGRDEQYDYFGLVKATPFQANVVFTLAGEPDLETLDQALDALLRLGWNATLTSMRCLDPTERSTPPAVLRHYRWHDDERNHHERREE